MASTEMAERRRAVRFPLSWPVVLENGAGTTRDISATGVYFESERVFPLGAIVRFAVHLPEGWDGANRLDCSGKVVRSERHGERFGIVVRFVRMRFGGGF